MSSLLLDTCAIIFLATGEPVTGRAQEGIARAANDETLYVSATSAWEVGMLSTKRRVDFTPDPETWFRRFTAQPGINIVPLNWTMMLEAWYLPDWSHADPADRLLVATAREMNVPIVTRDRRILEYAATGNVKAIAC